MAGKNMNLCYGNVYVSTRESLVLVLEVWSVCYFFSQLPFWFCIRHVTACPLFPVNHLNFRIWIDNKIIWSCTDRTIPQFLWVDEYCNRHIYIRFWVKLASWIIYMSLTVIDLGYKPSCYRKIWR